MKIEFWFIFLEKNKTNIKKTELETPAAAAAKKEKRIKMNPNQTSSFVLHVHRMRIKWH